VLAESIVCNGDLKLAYGKYGEGEQVVICFHGHGRTPDDFEFLIRENRKIISIVLFHHGSSFFPEQRIEKNPLTREEFILLFKSILEKENISNFDVVAFSQGGRFALIVFENFFSRICSMNLISPDGMDSNSFYNRMSRKKWARQLFTNMEKHPNRFIYLTKVGKKMRLVRPKVASFVENFAQDKSNFKRASLTWRGFRELQPNENRLKEILSEFRGNFQIIMGSYDQVIRPKQAYAFAQRLGKPKIVKEIPCGHNFFSAKNQKLLEDVIII
jgi:pimeloyl-ACP methyl ester carboxylesterase